MKQTHRLAAAATLLMLAVGVFRATGQTPSSLEVQPSPGLIANGLVTEVEAWQLEEFDVENYGGRQVISRKKSQAAWGTATTTFRGKEGYYRLRVLYVDEPDGVSEAHLLINDRPVGRWQFDGIEVEALRWKEFDGVHIKADDKITLRGRSGNYECSRIIGIEVHPSKPPAATTEQAVAPVTFSTDLVVLAEHRDLSDAPRWPTVSNGSAGRYLLELKEGQELRLLARANYAGFDSSLIYELIPFGKTEPAASGQLVSETPDAVQTHVPPQAPGLYELKVRPAPGTRASSVRLTLDVPAVVPSDDRGANLSQGFFFVPRGTSAVAVQLSGRAIVLDAAGDTLLDQWSDGATPIRIDVPKGSDDQLWHFQGNLGALVGVPPYVSWQPRAMLVPRECVK